MTDLSEPQIRTNFDHLMMISRLEDEVNRRISDIDWRRWIALAGQDPSDWCEVDWCIPSDRSTTAILFGGFHLVVVEQDIDDDETGSIMFECYAIDGANEPCPLSTLDIEEGELVR